MDPVRNSSSDQLMQFYMDLRHGAARELTLLVESVISVLSVDLRTRRGLINYAIDTGSSSNQEKETDPMPMDIRPLCTSPNISMCLILTRIFFGSFCSVWRFVDVMIFV